ncbi:hypothetical protein EVG20_g3712 [Dentipellis fragilis]|uniref:Uncharacterized protein n=1 Tax=Dentipellis fragilis TaxID=205917 RepID=A0A4Y9Z235_9AGAM|nr:hypothetical protein EVG20_g3712 [Dentipellis fragilis]
MERNTASWRDVRASKTSHESNTKWTNYMDPTQPKLTSSNDKSILIPITQRKHIARRSSLIAHRTSHIALEKMRKKHRLYFSFSVFNHVLPSRFLQVSVFHPPTIGQQPITSALQLILQPIHNDALEPGMAQRERDVEVRRAAASFPTSALRTQAAESKKEETHLDIEFEYSIAASSSGLPSLSTGALISKHARMLAAVIHSVSRPITPPVRPAPVRPASSRDSRQDAGRRIPNQAPKPKPQNPTPKAKDSPLPGHTLLPNPNAHSGSGTAFLPPPSALKNLSGLNLSVSRP